MEQITSIDLYNIDLSNIDLSILKYYNKEFLGEPGKEHYTLLAYFSSCLNNTYFIDIGTNYGNSAIALSYNSSNKVITFDIVKKDLSNLNNRNIEFKKENLFEKYTLEKYSKILLECPLIFLDIDPHEGINEYLLYNWLKQNNYKGLLICDDIHYFKGMRDNFWL